MPNDIVHFFDVNAGFYGHSTNLKNYQEYKNRGADVLRAHQADIARLEEDEAENNGEEQ